MLCVIGLLTDSINAIYLCKFCLQTATSQPNDIMHLYLDTEETGGAVHPIQAYLTSEVKIVLVKMKAILRGVRTLNYLIPINFNA